MFISFLNIDLIFNDTKKIILLINLILYKYDLNKFSVIIILFLKKKI